MKKVLKNGRVISFGCRFDRIDPRDYRFTAAPVPLPNIVDNRQHVVRIMDQGSEGACTGHAVCCAAEFLYKRFQNMPKDLSQRWAYRKARENDEWPGENYHGSSTRAAIKAWNKHGICEEQYWPYEAYPVDDEDPNFNLVAWEKNPLAGAAENARKFPLQTYSRCHSPYEIRHAIYKHGIVIVGAVVHSGWYVWGAGRIPYSSGIYEIGRHAFVLVGYDEQKQVYYVANSWGSGWGEGGFAEYSFVDANQNIADAWVTSIPTTPDPPVTPDPIVHINTIQLISNKGQYVGIDHKGKLYAKYSESDNASQFKLISASSNKFALQASNGKYVCAEKGGGGDVIANRDWIRGWESFEIFDLGRERVALRAKNGQFLCAEDGGGRELKANRNWIKSWETFKMVKLER